MREPDKRGKIALHTLAVDKNRAESHPVQVKGSETLLGFQLRPSLGIGRRGWPVFRQYLFRRRAGLRPNRRKKYESLDARRLCGAG